MKYTAVLFCLTFGLWPYARPGYAAPASNEIEQLIEDARETGAYKHGLAQYDIKRLVRHLRKSKSSLAFNHTFGGIRSTRKYGILVQLIEEGMIPMDYVSGQKNLLHIVIRWPYTDEFESLIKYFVEQGFDAGKPELEVIGEQSFGSGYTPIHSLSEQTDIPTDVFESLLELLLAKGGDIHAKNADGLTACQLVEAYRKEANCERVGILNSQEDEPSVLANIPPCYCASNIPIHPIPENESKATTFLLVELSGMTSEGLELSINGKKLEFLDTVQQRLLAISEGTNRVYFTCEQDVLIGTRSKAAPPRRGSYRPPNNNAGGRFKPSPGGRGPQRQMYTEASYLSTRPIESYVNLEASSEGLNKLVFKMEITDREQALASGGKYYSGVRIGTLEVANSLVDPSLDTKIKQTLVFDVLTK